LVQELDVLVSALDSVVHTAVADHSTSEVDLVGVIGLLFVEVQDGIRPSRDLRQRERQRESQIERRAARADSHSGHHRTRQR
jgi:hypothetical protein